MALIIYFREHSRITDYCYSRPVVLSLWKSFFARFFSRYKLPCYMEKWIVTDSNCEPSGYEPDALTIAPTILSGFAIFLRYLNTTHFYFRRTVTASVTCYPVANRRRRNDRIWTCDFVNPNHEPFQTWPYSENREIWTRTRNLLSLFWSRPTLLCQLSYFP